MTLVIMTLVIMTLVIMTLVIMGFLFGSTGGRELAAARNATTASLGRGRPRPRTGAAGLRLALSQIGELRRRVAADDDRDVTCALADAAGAATRPWPESLHGRALVGVTRRHVELLGRDVVVVLRVRHRRIEALTNDLGHRALGELEDFAGPAVRQVADEVEHLARLVRRDVRVADGCPGAGPLVGLVAEGH